MSLLLLDAKNDRLSLPSPQLQNLWVVVIFSGNSEVHEL